MAITEGDRLPDADMLRMGSDGPEAVSLVSLTAGRKVVLFAVPGAFTGVCTTAHVPSFIRTRDRFAEKGIEDIVCVAVNDPFVMRAWGESTGATVGGITMLADADGAFTRAVGMGFDAPSRGLNGRSRRYAAIVEDGVVRTLHVEEGSGTCEVSGGEALLATL